MRRELSTDIPMVVANILDPDREEVTAAQGAVDASKKHPKLGNVVGPHQMGGYCRSIQQ
jgi:hypothetical protein